MDFAVGRLVIVGVWLFLSLGCVTPAQAVEAPRAAEDVSDVFPTVIDSVALIEVETRAFDSRQGRVTNVDGLGSGVLISDDGLVMTAAHVIHTADRIKVYFGDPVGIDAKVISSDPLADVALIKLDWVPDDLEPAKLADSDKARVGEQVFVVGAPLGVSHTLTVGHLSARRAPAAMMTGLSNAELFQTDAAINQGNSGGPLFNLRGEVLGIVSHMISVSGGFDGLGFAVTSNAARELLLERSPFWGGMAAYMLSGKLAEIFNVPQAYGLLVQVVAKDSPAERLGLRGGSIKATIGREELVVGGDIILEVQGVRLSEHSAPELRRRLAELKPGQSVTVEVLREGELVELQAPYSRE